MDAKARERLTTTLHEIQGALQRDDLTPEKREELERHAANLSGALLSTWFPVDWPRRLIMAGIFCIGLFGVVTGAYKFAYVLLIIPIFSPRLMGWLAFFLGRIFSANRT